MKITITIALAISLMGNMALLIYIAVQNETLSLMPRLKNELNLITKLIPSSLNKSQIQSTLESAGYEVENGGEYYNAPKPNSTVAVGSTYFVFNVNDSLIQIYSLSNSLAPIYEKP